MNDYFLEHGENHADCSPNDEDIDDEGFVCRQRLCCGLTTLPVTLLSGTSRMF
jgi:hypothetical protein